MKGEVLISMVAQALRDLPWKVVYLGGSTTQLHFTDTAAPDPELTDDVDVVVEVTSSVEYLVTLREKLIAAGAREDSSEGAPPCRWLLGGIKVDIMTADGAIFGFSNRWYPLALETARHRTLFDGTLISLIHAPVFVATKLEAYLDRGKGDCLASKDIEDVIAVLDGRPELGEELAALPAALQDFVRVELSSLLSDPHFAYAVEGYLHDAPSRAPRTLERVRSIARRATTPMTNNSIVQRLWNLCHILRDDGITYHQYVTELTYLLFLKMMQERGAQFEKQIPEGLRWKDLESKEGTEQLTFYRKMLIELGDKGSGRVEAIFAGAQSALTQPKNLARLVEDIDKIDWFEAEKEGLGDLYEGLLEKNAGEKKSGAGQYFTPRPLINSMVNLTQPQPGELIEDPAAGTGGFLIAADKYIKARTDDLYDLPTKSQEFQRNRAYVGMELVPETRRLGLMNLMLHDIEGSLHLGNTLSAKGESMGKVDLVLTNPPFGTAKGGGVTRDDFTFQTNNKQLAFLQHIYRSLKVPKKGEQGGRAAVVLPDNVLFEENAGTQIRRDLMDKCNLHTILRLPTGIFYAQGVKTNVLFFTRGATDTGNTKAVWVYDMRANMPSFGKRTPLTEEHFRDFEQVFGDDPYGGSKRKDLGEEGRFRSFTRAEIEKRGDNLDISWLRDESATSADDLPEPDVIAAEILARLQTAMAAIQELQELLDE